MAASWQHDPIAVMKAGEDFDAGLAVIFETLADDDSHIDRAPYSSDTYIPCSVRTASGGTASTERLPTGIDTRVLSLTK